ncbi:two-component system response regulator [Pseudomarimonas salicorniae]|uniref:EAL domain-containing protein n=1 Tax=Pseudomarimonas salicorniae TaxID=2933270 RepID=A0ABT0GKV2_9GAMM|nr:EAL domain-containing protein [Lysobacter sp. CAU 1642]MCK7595048.1 EAL domain-containing protein [Lysobacter sp. CAU 1642]
MPAQVVQDATARLLIVDDAPSNIHLLHQAVEGLGQVFFATDGESALVRALELRPNVILLDIEMPGLDGYAVFDRLKATPELQDVAVIFVTAHDRAPHERAVLDLGGVDFLHKPIDLPVARARVRTQLALQQKTRELDRARRDLAGVLDSLPGLVLELDEAGRVRFCNDRCRVWLGRPAADLLGGGIDEVLPVADRPALIEAVHSARGGGREVLELALDRDGGGGRHAQAVLVPRESGVLLLLTDITDRVFAERALAQEKERIRITLESIGDAVIATDRDGIVTFVNPIAEDMTGWLRADAVGRPIEEVMQLHDPIEKRSLVNPIRLAISEERTVGMALNCQLRRRDGRDFAVEDSAAPIRDHRGEIIGAIVVFHDVSEARAMAIKMTHLAKHDALTNLPNRILLQDRCLQAVEDARREQGRVAMLLIDLDRFLHINDAVGHAVGDQILQTVAQRLRAQLHGGGTVSRQGGDEFIVLLPGVDELEQVGMLAHQLLAVVAEPYWCEDRRYDLTASIGISIFPDDASDVETLHRHADAAMYRAKQDGRARFHFFSAEIEESLRSRHRLASDLRLALEGRQFRLHYQPQVAAGSGRIVGVEALLRWPRSGAPATSPAAFIPMAEESGLIVPLGAWVLGEACAAACRWRDAGAPTRVSVNVSAVQFLDPGWLDLVRATLARTGLTAGLLELEITEGVLARDLPRTLGIINELKAIGVSIALDDFGTGYSSLSYLKRFPIDVLKIDQSFVREMTDDPCDAAIVGAVTRMAQGLGLQLVAEGVETPAQADLLAQLGCGIMQGYRFSRPVPEEDLLRLLLHGTLTPDP